MGGWWSEGVVGLLVIVSLATKIGGLKMFRLRKLKNHYQLYIDKNLLRDEKTFKEQFYMSGVESHRVNNFDEEKVFDKTFFKNFYDMPVTLTDEEELNKKSNEEKCYRLAANLRQEVEVLKSSVRVEKLTPHSDDIIKQSIRRSRRQLKRICLNNFKIKKTSFLTLTFKDNITDRAESWKLFDLGIKRIRYFLKLRGEKLTYLCVPEKQKRGAWHFHLVLFNSIFIEHKTLLKQWQYGGCWINTIVDANHLSNYISKYFVKSFENGFYSKKRYSCSRGLMVGVVILKGQKAVNEFHNLVRKNKNIDVVNEYYNEELKIYSAVFFIDNYSKDDKIWIKQQKIIYNKKKQEREKQEREKYIKSF